MDEFGPWTPKYHSTLALVPHPQGGGIRVHVTPGWVGSYGAVVPTLVAQPSPGKVVVGIRLRAPGRSRIEVFMDEFSSGPTILDKMVPATRRWHQYTFRAPVKGRWLGIALYVGRSTDGKKDKWLELRDLTVKVYPRTRR